MSENPPRLDLRKPRSRIVAPSPMATDRLYNAGDDAARMQLISPPPEEELRKVSGQRPPPFTPSLLAAGDEEQTPANIKRKRNQQTPKPAPAGEATTPNPRVRKQVRRETDDVEMESPTRSQFPSPLPPTPSKTNRVLIQSPHIKNPDADYIPSVHLLTQSSPGRDEMSELGSMVRRKLLVVSSRRSATPIPPYEPPRDVFTPPRQIVLAPPTTSRKSRASRKLPPIQVKQELPDIDLTVPMPPASPTDDPLLLSSDIEELEQFPPPVKKTPRAKKSRKGASASKKTPISTGKTLLLQTTSTAKAAEMVLQEEMQDSPPRRQPLNFDLPPSSPVPEQSDDEANFDWTQNATRPMESTEDSMMQMDAEDESVEPVALPDLDSALKEDANGGWSDSDDDNTEVEGRGEFTGRFRVMKVRTKTDPPSEATRERMEEWGRPISPFPGVRRLHSNGENEVTIEEEKEKPLAPCEAEEEEAKEEEEVMRMSIEPEEEPEPVLEELPVAPATPATLGLEFTPARTPARRILVEEEDVRVEPTALADDGDSDDLSDLEDFSMVKIVSADPRAAARAAAILKQYDYECFTKLSMKRRKMDQRRYSSLDDLSHDLRRKSLLKAGISKEAEKQRRRSTLGMGIIGDRVVIPGSPSVTLPELLDQVEKEMSLNSPGMAKETPRALLNVRTPKDPFKTPIARYHAPLPKWSAERVWTKEEWKLLDSCFTDERLGGNMSPGQELRPVDDVDVESVVDRFMGMARGEGIISIYGAAWSRDSLRQRVRALQKKQREGSVAPPTTPVGLGLLGGGKRHPSMEVPDFTPLGRRAQPPRKSRPTLPLPVTEKAPFSDLARRESIAPYLLAPRYSHLLDEARVVSAEVVGLSAQHQSTQAELEDDFEATPEPTDEGEVEPVFQTPEPQVPQTPGSFGKKLKGIFFSYMPTLSKTAPPPSRRPPRGAQPSLPLPPPDVLNKNRGPVTTPARPALPKMKHPKELVDLQPAPPPKPSMIPRLNKQPQRLVQLHPVPLPAPAATSMGPPRPRRSSGSSVKDLVKGFEEMKRVEEEKQRLEQVKLKRQQQPRPHSSLGFRGAGSLMNLSKPGWKP